METNGKMRKGFMKGKLVMSFYRASNGGIKPSTTEAAPPYKAAKKSPPATAYILNQDKVNPQPKHNVSYVVPQTSTTATCGMFDNPYGMVADEGVDAKAANYISCVRERFKLDVLILNDQTTS